MSAYVIHRLARAPRPDNARRVEWLARAQLVAGVAFASVLPDEPAESAGGASRTRDTLTVAALTGIQAGQLAVAQCAGLRWRGTESALSSLWNYTVSVSLVEELWFRELWFRICRRRFGSSVLLGSLLFGLYHAPRGWRSVLSTAAIGCVFAVARYRGASLGSLIIAHGLMDWLNRDIMPGARYRLDPSSSTVMFAAYCSALAYGLSRLPFPHEVDKRSMIHLNREPARVIRSSTSGSISSSSSSSSSSLNPGLVPMMS
jgi:membrane protease YdiL (CAAX protease family)